MRSADQGALLPCEAHPRVLQHLADSDDDEAAEAFGVVSSRNFGSTRAACALYISPRSPLYLP